MNHIININENELNTLLADDKTFKFLRYGYNKEEERKRLISYSIKGLRGEKSYYSSFFYLEKQIKSDLQEFQNYISTTSDNLSQQKQLLYATIKKSDNDFDNKYLSLIEKESIISSNTAKFILCSLENKIMNINNDRVIINLLNILSKEKEKTHNSTFLYTMKKIVSNDTLLKDYKNEIAEILENYERNQPSFNRKDYAFFNENKKNIMFLYENNKLPNFLTNIYENKPELMTQFVNKTNQEISEMFPNYFKKNNGIQISVKKELELHGKKKKEVLADKTIKNLLIIEFDVKRFCASNVSDSVYLAKSYRSLAKVLENKCKNNELALEDFVYTEQKGFSKFLLQFNDKDMELKLKEIIESFIMKVANNSMNKKESEYNVRMTMEKDVEKYFSYFTLSKELDNDDMEKSEIKNINKRLKI